MNGRKRSTGTRFVVDLGDVRLPPMTVKVVEAEIRSVVLRALATVDFGGQRAMEAHDWQRLPGGVAGGVWGPIPGDARSSPTPDGSEELSPQDHTLILRAVMAHPQAVVANLDGKRSASPSGTEVLAAALQVDQIDPYTKERIEAVLDVLPKIGGARSRTSAGVQRSVKELQGQITGRSIPERVRVLRESKSRYRAREGMSEGMEIAAQILEDGASSIYSAEHPFYRMLQEGKRKARKLSPRDVADEVGATVGGAVGAVVGGVSVGTGAVAASTEASSGVVIGAFLDWLD